MKFKLLPFALMLALPACAVLPTTPTAQNGQALNKTDTDFVMTSYDIIQLDDQEGQLAAMQASDPRVRQVALDLISKAEAMDPKLDTVIGTDGITPHGQLSDQMQSRATALSALSGKAFDQAYLADQIRSHQRGVAVFQTEASNTQHKQLRDLANASLPVVQDSLTKLQAIQATM